MKSSELVSDLPVSASALRVGCSDAMLDLRSAALRVMRLLAAVPNRSREVSASSSWERRSDNCFTAGVMREIEVSRAWFSAAIEPAILSSPDSAVVIAVRRRSMVVVSVESWVSRIRMRSVRPPRISLAPFTISPTWASPPPLTITDNADSVCSVVGYCVDRSSPITSPSASRAGFAPSFGADSEMCWEPSRLVCPMAAVAFLGRSTPPLRRTLTRACQSRNVIDVIRPTSTSPTRTGELTEIVVTSGISMTTLNAPSPRPAPPGICTDSMPCQPQEATDSTATTSAARQAIRRLIGIPPRAAATGDSWGPWCAWPAPR